MSSIKLLDIGFGNLVSSNRVVALVSPDSAPIKRVVQQARDSGRLIDASYGRKTQTVILCDTDHIVLSALTLETLADRMGEKDSDE